MASAFSDDAALLEGAGYGLEVEISQPGFIRAVVSRDDEATRIDWAHDSAWRFMPPIRDTLGGFVLHDVDLAVNKTLALADAEAFARSGPTDEVGCLYYSAELESFTVPDRERDLGSQGPVAHFGAPGGVLPRVADV